MTFKEREELEEKIIRELGIRNEEIAYIIADYIIAELNLAK